MPLISLTVHHGQTHEEARRRLGTAVEDISSKFGALLRRVEWAVDCNRVRLEGIGFWIELSVDALAVHVTGDAQILGRLLGPSPASRLRQLIETTFRKQLP
jgi:hypothetical protein